MLLLESGRDWTIPQIGLSEKRHSPEQIFNKLRQVGVAVAGGKSVGQAVHGLGVTDHTYYRWRQEYNTI